MKKLSLAIVILVGLFLITGISYCQNATEYHNKGLEYGARGKFKEAEQAFQKALEVDHSYTPSMEALNLTKGVLKNKTDKEFVIHTFQGTIDGDNGRYDAAIAEFKKAIAINPNDAYAHYNLGVAYRANEMYDAAIAEYKKAIAINPNDAYAHYNLGVIYGSRKMWDEVITELKKVIDLDPDAADAQYNLAVAYYQKGLYDLAIEHCDRAKELGKFHPGFLEALKPYRK